MDGDVLARREARLAELVALQAEHARLHAREQQLLYELARDGDAVERSKRWVREEIAAALGVSPDTAGQRLSLAADLLERLPGVYDRLAEGRLTLLHARILAEATAPLDDLSAARVQDAALTALDRAGGLLPFAAFRARVNRIVHAVDPRTAAEQHQAEYRQRRTWLRPQPAGMAELGAYLRADHAVAAEHHLDALARTLPEDGRTLEQKRADVLIDLLTGRNTPSHRGPEIRVVVAASTLLAVDENPAELAGYGPIPAELARALAEDPSGVWRRLLTDPAGHLLHLSSSRYRPPAALREQVTARHTTCTFPGCARDAARAELDHIREWPAGPTTTANLHPLCRRHHHLKHETDWHVQATPAGIRWISPTGRRYLTPPTDHPADTSLDRPPGQYAATDDPDTQAAIPVLLSDDHLDYLAATGQLHPSTPPDPDPPPF